MFVPIEAILNKCLWEEKNGVLTTLKVSNTIRKVSPECARHKITAHYKIIKPASLFFSMLGETSANTT